MLRRSAGLVRKPAGPEPVAAVFLLGSGPHSGTTFEILGSLGVAIIVLVGAVWSRFFRRGPLEYLLNGTTRLASFVR